MRGQRISLVRVTAPSEEELAAMAEAGEDEDDDRSDKPRLVFLRPTDREVEEQA